MKKILLFGSGFITGIIATILVAFLISVEQPNDGLHGLTLFPEKGECITTKSLEVFQVIEPNMALASIGNVLDGIVVLLINYDGKHYYDSKYPVKPIFSV